VALTLSIFILTIVLIMARPRPLNEATAALLGAVLMLAAGIITPKQSFEVLRDTSNVLLFFLGLMVICVVADRAGFFEWSASKALTLAGGKGRRLLLVLFGLGTIITTFFSNDATALVLTPIVFVTVTKLKLNPLPYVFACAFIANTASMMLPISNPVNLLPVDRFGITLGDYLHFLLLPTVLAIAVNVVLFILIFRKVISSPFTHDATGFAVKTDNFFIFTCVGLVLTAIGYIVTSVYGLPLSWPALGGAVLLLTGGFVFRRLSLKKVNSGISWSILLFIFSLALLVKGLENAGITEALGRAMADLSSQNTLGAILATSFGTAIGSNLINNWSMMMVSVSSIGQISNSVATSGQALIYSSIIGADLGPNITVIGSLSSMLWLVLLRQRGLNIHPLQYLKLGLIVTPPMLITGALGLYLCSLF
jgi:arsenical pump membrane protein